MVTTAVSSPCLETSRPEIASIGMVAPGLRIDQVSSPRQRSDWPA